MKIKPQPLVVSPAHALTLPDDVSAYRLALPGMKDVSVFFADAASPEIVTDVWPEGIEREVFPLPLSAQRLERVPAM